MGREFAPLRDILANRILQENAMLKIAAGVFLGGLGLLVLLAASCAYWGSSLDRARTIAQQSQQPPAPAAQP